MNEVSLAKMYFLIYYEILPENYCLERTKQTNKQAKKQKKQKKRKEINNLKDTFGFLITWIFSYSSFKGICFYGFIWKGREREWVKLNARIFQEV